MRLIDADALMKSIGCEDATKYGNKTAEQQHNSYSTMMMYEIADEIDDAPTIEAKPVRHGTWIGFERKYNGETVYYVRCSACGRERPFDYGLRYCPTCGVKMDGGVSNEGRSSVSLHQACSGLPVQHVQARPKR